MKILLLLILPLYLISDTSFISKKEYASQLYKNPRGIGCYHCHGKKGEGKLIAKYTHKGKKKEFRGPTINNITYYKFHKALDERKSGMPRYFLTNKEIETLYFYVTQKKSDKL